MASLSEPWKHTGSAGAFCDRSLSILRDALHGRGCCDLRRLRQPGSDQTSVDKASSGTDKAKPKHSLCEVQTGEMSKTGSVNFMTIKEILEPYKIHPAAALFPMMTESELSELSEDIKAHGLLYPIVKHEGQILDGRNRLVACLRAGIVADFSEWNVNGSPTSWILSVNLKRRQLKPGQKAIIARKSLPIFEAEAKQRQKIHAETAPGKKNTSGKNSGSDSGEAREKAAAAVGVNPRYVSDVKNIERNAPELIAKIESGEMTIPQAKQKANALNSKQIWDAGEVATRPANHEPEDDESDGLWNLKQCWRKAKKKEKADFLKWVKEISKSKTK